MTQDSTRARIFQPGDVVIVRGWTKTPERFVIREALYFDFDPYFPASYTIEDEDGRFRGSVRPTDIEGWA